MQQYIFRRTAQAIPLLFVISIIMFALISAMPGGLLTSYQNRDDLSPQDLQRLEQKYGVNDPWPVKYLKWLGNLLQGDWGNSLVSKRPVTQEIGDRLPNTLLLMGITLFVTIIIAVPLGILSALKQYSIFDHIATTLAFAGQSLPIFWFGLLLIIVFAVQVKGADGRPLLPGSGLDTLGQPFSHVDRARHLILPVAMLTINGLALYMRYMRSSMLDVKMQDYIRTARGKGLSERQVVWRHMFRNALVPLVTIIALDLPALFIGAVFTETIFGISGLGRYYVDSASKTDYPAVMALLMITAFLIIFSNLLADLMYAVVDPRIQYS
jgi:peptide/nickel transport system permease protein